MNTIFMNSKNTKTSDLHRLLLSLKDKIDLRRKINILLYQILVFTMHGKILKSHVRTINLKYLLQHGMKNLNYLINHSRYSRLF